MIEHFRLHRASFDTLRVLLARDADPAAVGGAGDAARRRVEEAIGAKKITTGPSCRPGTIYVTVLMHNRPHKGYYWSQWSPRKLVDEDLDRGYHEGHRYRPLDGNWYLYLYTKEFSH